MAYKHTQARASWVVLIKQKLTQKQLSGAVDMIDLGRKLKVTLRKEREKIVSWDNRGLVIYPEKKSKQIAPHPQETLKWLIPLTVSVAYY